MPHPFQVTARCETTRARAGRLTLVHGTVDTPIFMPVGTLGTVKALAPEDLTAAGAQIILGNTYHPLSPAGMRCHRTLFPGSTDS